MRSDADDAEALLDEAERLDGEGRHEEEIAVYDDVIRCFGASADPQVVEHVLRARLDKAITLYDLDREREALGVLEELCARAATNPVHATGRFDWVFARATTYQAYCLQALDRDDEALARYDEVEARFGDGTDADVLTDLAEALRYKAELLWFLERHSEAVETMGRLIRRFDATDDEDIAEEVALGSAARGRWLSKLDHHQEALEAYDVAVRHADHLPAGVLASVLYGRGCMLHELGRADEALEQFAEVVRRFASHTSAVARGCAARAGNWQGIVLRRAGRLEDAIAAHRAVVALPADDVLDVRAERSRALSIIASCLAHDDRFDEALAAYDELLVAVSDDEELAGDAEEALHAKVALLAHLQRAGETIVLTDALADRGALDSAGPAELESAMSAKGVALAAEGRFEEAIEAFDAAIDAVADSDEPALRCAAGLALCNKATALHALGHEEEALATQGEAVERFGADMLDVLTARLRELETDDHASARVRRARLRVRLGQTLAMCGRREDALLALGDLLADTGPDDNDAEIAELRSAARLMRAQLLDAD